LTKIVAEWRAAGVSEFVYLMQMGDDGPVKVGRALDPDKRCYELQCGNPEQLVVRDAIPGGATVESLLHQNFWEHRLMGEWFDCPAILIPFFAGLHEKAGAFLDERGVPPVGFHKVVRGSELQWEPFGALDRAIMFDRYKVGRAIGGNLGNRSNVQGLSIDGCLAREFERELLKVAE
jgi:hypothetical protein